MNARKTLTTTALVTLFALSMPVLGAADDDNNRTRDNQTQFAEYTPSEVDDIRLSAIGGGAARAPERNPHLGNDLTRFQRFIRWMVVVRH